MSGVVLKVRWWRPVTTAAAVLSFSPSLYFLLPWLSLLQLPYYVKYFDPDNILQIKKKITEMIENKKLRKKNKTNSYKHLKKFSWEKSATKTLKIIGVL